VTIALSVVKKYAETLSIGLSWGFSPKCSFGVHGRGNILDLHQKQ